MRAVNLIPSDARGRASNRGPSTGMQVPVYVLLGLLAAAVALVTVYVLANNSITSRTAQLNNLKTEVAQEQAAVARLGEFTKFSQLAQTRIGTVKSIAAARFDWHGALLGPLEGGSGQHHADLGRRAPSCPVRAPARALAPARAPCASAVTAPAFELSRLHRHPGRRRPADVAAAPDQRRHSRHVQQFAGRQLHPPPPAGRASRALPAARTSRSSCSSRPSRTPEPPASPRSGRTTTTDHRRNSVTTRDRIVIMVVLAVGAVVAGWMLVVSPKRDQDASRLSTQITAQQSQLDTAPQPAGRRQGRANRVRGPVRAARQPRRGRSAR